MESKFNENGGINWMVRWLTALNPELWSNEEELRSQPHTSQVVQNGVDVSWLYVGWRCIKFVEEYFTCFEK
jgi:hypothetical protein